MASKKWFERSRISLLLIFTAVPSVSYAQICGDAHGHAGLETRTIRLEAKSDSPAFHFRSEGFVVFISLKTVLDSLHSLPSSRPAETRSAYSCAAAARREPRSLSI
jgi:hypothetical protein